ncbi:hypothetical protein [Neptuniibacter sp. QD37_11]|uniref:hypothetical protein n=1 Tax=Neptuniibacter sp. QD37_11 TaxID=3398209 RepID=UPI0039F5449A
MSEACQSCDKQAKWEVGYLDTSLSSDGKSAYTAHMCTEHMEHFYKAPTKMPQVEVQTIQPLNS